MPSHRYRLACGVDGTGCPECDEHVNESVRTMETNVDRVDRGVNAYIVSIQDGISRCSKHGNAYYRKKTSGNKGEADG